MIHVRRATRVVAGLLASYRWFGKTLCALLVLLAPALSGAVMPAANASASCADVRVWISYRLPSGAPGSMWQTPECDDRLVPGATVTVDPSQRRQPVMGFGAALTGSAAALIATRIDAAQRTQLLRALFAPPPVGIGLSLLRLPIGSTDLSRRRYSLAPLPPARTGGTLKLDLAPMQNTTLPVLRDILRIRPDLPIIATTWSPPGWMKTSGRMIGGRLLRAHEGDFTNYLADFVRAMQGEGVPIYALTLQNEPDYQPRSYPGMEIGPKQRARIITHDLAPALARDRLPTKILGLDGNWDRFGQPMHMLAQPAVAKEIAGIAWHCYIGSPAWSQELLHKHHPDKWQLVTECTDSVPTPQDGETVAAFADRGLIEPMRHWSRGIILWSLALDTHYGPHDGGCDECLGVVAINRHTGKVAPTRDYYVLAHFSAFVRPGAYRVASSGAVDGIENVGFHDAQNHATTIVLANRRRLSRVVRIVVGARHVTIRMPAKSLATVQIGGCPGSWCTRRIPAVALPVPVSQPG